MLCFLLCQCPNFNCSVWLEYSVTSQRLSRKYETMHQVQVWCERQSFLTVVFFLFIYFLLILFFARISLNKYIYFMLQSAMSFMDIYAYNFALVKNWRSFSQMCSYISVTFIYKLSVHNLFLFILTLIHLNKLRPFGKK